MMEVILYLYDTARKLVAKNIPLSRIRETGIFEDLIGIKYHVDNKNLGKFDEYIQKIDQIYKDLMREYDE